MAKTSGFTWLELSLTSFNGSGYADMSSAGAFLDSYRAYKLWKGKNEAVMLLDEYWQSALVVAEALVKYSDGAGHVPNYNNWKAFNNFRRR